jgi:hypothetical protein
MEELILAHLTASSRCETKTSLREAVDGDKATVKKAIKKLLKRGRIELDYGDNLVLPSAASESSSSSKQHKTDASPPIHRNSSTLTSEWPFPTDFGDHFETPLEAYRDVKPVLKRAAKALAKSSSELRIYDPYFCRGLMLSHMASLGFFNVTNLPRDFYADVASSQVPAHDVLLTNPPYSGDHKSKIFSFLLDRHRAAAAPFLLLLPAWTSKWLPWRTFLFAMARLSSGKDASITMDGALRKVKKLNNLADDLEVKAGCFYYAPGAKYEYTAAVESRDSAPFFSLWFVGGFTDTASMEAAIAALQKKDKGKAAPGRVYRTLRGLIDAGVVEDAKQNLDDDPAARRRREEAIAKLEEARRLKGRARNYADRDTTKYTPCGDSENVEALLALEGNSRACRHYFVGESGCVRGEKCRFSHTLVYPHDDGGG